MFPAVAVRQDIKHIINRVVEQLSKKSEVYGDACRKLHAAVVGGDTSVIDRAGQLRKVAKLLDHRDVIISRMLEWELQYKTIDPTLFLGDFDNTFKIQLHHFALGCVDDITLTQGVPATPKNYLEMTDGKFILLRGTNRDESMHRRMNGIWPDWCGEELADVIKTAFYFNWTAHRLCRPCSFDPRQQYSVNINPSLAPIKASSFIMKPLNGNSGSASSRVQLSLSSGSSSATVSTSSGVTVTSATGDDNSRRSVTLSLSSQSSSTVINTGPNTMPTGSISDDELMGINIDSLLEQRSRHQCTTVTQLLKVGCSISLTNIKQVQSLLRYKCPHQPLRLATSSGNLLGSALPVRTGINKNYERMDTVPGSKKASLTPAKLCARKRQRVSDGIASAGASTESSTQQLKCLTRWTKATTGILIVIIEDTQGSIRWEHITEEFNKRSDEIATATQLKARWQQVKKQKHQGITNSADAFVAPPATTQRTLSDIEGTCLPLPPAALPPPALATKHPLRDYKYTLDEISAVKLETAGKGEEFSAAEQEVLDYILTVKMKVQPGKRVDWVTVHEYWSTTAKIQKLNKPYSKVLMRTKEQLEERGKTIRRKYQTNR